MNIADAYMMGVNIARAYAKKVGFETARDNFMEIRMMEDGLDILLTGLETEVDAWFEYKEEELF